LTIGPGTSSAAYRTTFADNSPEGLSWPLPVVGNLRMPSGGQHQRLPLHTGITTSKTVGSDFRHFGGIRCLVKRTSALHPRRLLERACYSVVGILRTPSGGQHRRLPLRT